jgi:predicted CopG family antitoxin
VQVMSFDLMHAGRVLFGSGFAAEHDWHGRLKTTYRRRAFETHPDRAGSLGRDPSELAREFSELTEAYRFLSGLRPVAPPRPEPRTAARPSEPSPRASRPAATASSAEHRHAERAPPPESEARRSASAPPRARHEVRERRPLPRRRLRFAEFLYYTGRASFSELVEAIVWQRRQRPNLGRIAVEFGFLEEDEVAEILKRRGREASHSVLFGEFAVRTGFLTPFQLLAALGRQKRLQKPIGEFFIERGIIERGEIAEICRRIFSHNAACLAA